MRHGRLYHENRGGGYDSSELLIKIELFMFIGMFVDEFSRGKVMKSSRKSRGAKDRGRDKQEVKRRGKQLASQVFLVTGRTRRRIV